jgi:RNA polymerase sigma-70 factor (ECF subfamily)
MRGPEDDGRSDADLLAAISQQDWRAFELLHARYAPWLMVVLSHRGADAATIEDVVQLTFIALWRKPHAWRGEGQVGAWIRGIAMHKLLDEQHPRSKMSAAIHLVPDVVVDGRRHAEPSAEEEFLRSQDVPCSEIEDALRKLSPKLLAVARCCWLDDLTISEAARALGLPPGTVKTRLMRARDQLREELDGALEHSVLADPPTNPHGRPTPEPKRKPRERVAPRERRVGGQPREELA